MSIWLHSSSVAPRAPTLDCPFCDSRLESFIDDESEFILNTQAPGINGDDGIHPRTTGICRECGWWQCSQTKTVSSHGCLIHAHYKAAEAALKRVDLTDQRTPIEEIRQYIRIRWSERNDVSPLMMEHLVADVFKNLGYSVRVTAYQKDGGIDILMLDDGTNLIGVQVKRTRNPVSVCKRR